MQKPVPQGETTLGASSSTPSKLQKLISSPTDRTNTILISILVASILIVAGIIILSIFISYLRKVEEFPILNMDVGVMSFWKNENSLCDPNNVENGSYRINFFNSDNVFVHSLVIREEEKKKFYRQL